MHALVPGEVLRRLEQQRDGAARAARPSARTRRPASARARACAGRTAATGVEPPKNQLVHGVEQAGLRRPARSAGLDAVARGRPSPRCAQRPALRHVGPGRRRDLGERPGLLDEVRAAAIAEADAARELAPQAPGDRHGGPRERCASLARVDAVDRRAEVEVDVAQGGLERVGDDGRADARRVGAIDGLVDRARTEDELREQPAVGAVADGDRARGAARPRRDAPRRRRMSRAVVSPSDGRPSPR